MTGALSAAVAAEIRRLLAERGMSGNALAKAAGMSQTTVARKVAGRQVIDLDDLPALCAALGVAEAVLIGLGAAALVGDS